MENKIVIQGDFNKEMVRRFKSDLRSYQTLPAGRVHVRIRSYGGDGETMAFMNGFVYYLSKYKGYKFIAEIEIAESAALLFAVNMHERYVTNESIGAIHLPESQDQETKLSQREHFIKIFEKQTYLSRSEIINLNNMPLSAYEMINFGIATKKFEDFNAANIH